MTATPVHRPFRVFSMMLLSGVLMSLMVVFARLSAETHPIVQVTFFRNTVGAVCLAVLIAGDKRGLELLKTKRAGGHFLRGLVGIIGLALNFWAASMLPLADASALFFVMPLIVTILSVPLLSEKVGWRRWLCVALGFLGILIIAQPSGDATPFEIFIALMGALGTALSVIMVRRLGSSEPEMRTVFYFFLFGAIVSAIFLPFYWTSPTLSSLIYLVATGLAGTLGQILLTRAYAEAPAAFLSPFNYLSILYGTFFGWLIWNEWPLLNVFIGAGIVIAAGLGNLAFESARARKAQDTTEVTYG